MDFHITEQFLFPGAVVGSSQEVLVSMAVFSAVKNQLLQSPHLLLSVNQNADQGLPPAPQPIPLNCSRLSPKEKSR